MTSMSLGDRIKALRITRGMTLEQVGNLVGVGKSTVRKWETGEIANMGRDKITLLSDALGVSVDYLLGREDVDGHRPPVYVHNLGQLYHQSIPMIGGVAGGAPIYDPEEHGVFVLSPIDCDAAMTVTGDSMAPGYQDGDIIYIKCRPDVPEGTIAVVFLDDEAVIKRVYKRQTGLTLASDNPAYPPIMAEFADYPNMRIFGEPVGFVRIHKPSIDGKIKKGF